MIYFLDIGSSWEFSLWRNLGNLQANIWEALLGPAPFCIFSLQPLATPVSMYAKSLLAKIHSTDLSAQAIWVQVWTAVSYHPVSSLCGLFALAPSSLVGILLSNNFTLGLGRMYMHHPHVFSKKRIFKILM